LDALHQHDLCRHIKRTLWCMKGRIPNQMAQKATDSTQKNSKD